MNNDHLYIYMLLCSNDHFYIGYTTDLERRWQEHVNGSPKCKYTRSFPPKKIAASWVFDDKTKSEVLSIESKLKKLSRKDKLLLTQKPELIFDFIN